MKPLKRQQKGSLARQTRSTDRYLPIMVSCVCRELREECEVTVDSLEEIGTITFEFVDDPPLLEVHLFKTHSYSGVPTETEGDAFPLDLNVLYLH